VSSARPTPWRGAGRRSAAVATVTALLALLLPTPAALATQDPGTVELTVSGFSGVLGPGSVQPANDDTDPRDVPEPPTDLTVRALVAHTGGDAVDQLRLVVEVHPPAATRGALRATVDDDEPTTVPSVHDTDIRPDDRLEAGEIAGVELVVPAAEIAWAEEGGVHPVRIAVQRGTEVLAEVTTAAVWLATVPEQPLATSMLWPLDTPPWRGPGGVYAEDADAALRPGGRLDAVLRALERHGDAGVVLAPAAHLLEDLRDRAEGYVRTERIDGGALESRRVDPESSSARRANDVLQRIRAVIDGGRHPPLVRPYADADLTALVGDPAVRDLAGELAVTGRRRLQRLAERAPDAGASVLPASTSPEVLDLIPGEIALVPYAAVEGPNPAAEPTLPNPVREVRSASGRPVTLLVGDPYLSDLLAEPPNVGPVLGSQRILAETAMVYFEEPEAARALSLHPPEDWSPSTELAGRLLGRLAAATWVELGPPAIVTSTPDTPARATLAEPGTPTLTEEQTGRLATALQDLDAAADARSSEPVLDGRDPSDLRDQLLRSTSRWFPAGSGEADALVADVRSAIDTTLADVRIASGSLVTLTSDTGAIPVTLQRGAGGPLAVQVEVASQGRLSWPEGRRSEVLLLEEGTTQTVSFQTRALSTGTFSVSVRVTDPTGRLELDRTTLSVRSTSISGPAISIIVGSVVVLLLAGLLRRRPRRRLELVR
jgi:hypothetical protein